MDKFSMCVLYGLIIFFEVLSESCWVTGFNLFLLILMNETAFVQFLIIFVQRMNSSSFKLSMFLQFQFVFAIQIMIQCNI
jgi:hypothetical protein